MAVEGNGSLQKKGHNKPLINMDSLLDLAVWAFKPDGLPNLKVLAYGDFSHSPRYKWTQILFYRNNNKSNEIEGAGPSSITTTDTTTVAAVAAAVYYPFRIMRPPREDKHLIDSIDDGVRDLLAACRTEPVIDRSYFSYLDEFDLILVPRLMMMMTMRFFRWGLVSIIRLRGMLKMSLIMIVRLVFLTRFEDGNEWIVQGRKRQWDSLWSCWEDTLNKFPGDWATGELEYVLLVCCQGSLF